MLGQTTEPLPKKSLEAQSMVKPGRFSALRTLTEQEPASPITVFTPAVIQGSITLKLDDILVEDRIRQYLDQQKVQELANSIHEFGFRGTLWVRRKQQQYYLVAGGRRYAACQLAGVKAVSVDVIEVSDTQAIMLELAENFQRQDLNPLEETVGILNLLESTLKITQDQIVSLFQKQQRRTKDPGSQESKENENNVILKHEQSEGLPFMLSQVEAAADRADLLNDDQRWAIVEMVFKMVGKLTPDSFRTNRLPLLKLPDAIQVVIANGSLEYSKARAIAKVQDEELRAALLNQAIVTGWSLSEIKAQVKATQDSVSSQSPQGEVEQFRSTAIEVFKRLKTTSLQGRSLKKAQRLLSELETLLRE
jgi:ParB family transcriptional regulator, chromosome partitioning protein